MLRQSHSLPIFYALIVSVIMFSDPGYAIDVSFSGDSGADNVGLESSYDLDTGSSVSEEATLDTQSSILEDKRDLSVLGDASAAQSCFGSGGYYGTATMSASNAGGHLSGYAYLTRQGMYAAQSADLSGSQAATGMALGYQGAAASVDGTVTDGSLNSYLQSCTGSANVAGQFSASGGSIQVDGSATQGTGYSHLTSTVSSVNGVPGTFDGSLFAHASLPDHATQLTQTENIAGDYKLIGRAMSSGVGTELKKSRRSDDGTFTKTVNVWSTDTGRYITGLAGYWFVKLGEDIQAVLDQAEEGDDVELDSGTFTENIVVDKFLSIYGQGIGVTTISAAASGQPTTTITYSGADTLSISDLTASGATGVGSSGILISGTGSVGNIELTNVGSTGNYYGVDVKADGAGNSVSGVKFNGLKISDSTAYGLQIYTANGGAISNLDLDGATISDSGVCGVAVLNNDKGTINGLSLDGATISGSGEVGVAVGNLGTIGDMSLNGAKISDSGKGGVYVENYGTMGDMSLDGATISSCVEGVSVKNYGTGTMGDMSLDGATISGAIWNGVEVENNGGTIGDLTMNKGSITGSGIYGLYLKNTGTIGTVAINNVNIYGNTNGGINCIGTSIDATKNWWGSDSGPYHSTLNPSGTGNSVSDGVTFNPWSTTPITT